MVELQLNQKIKEVQTNWGGEFRPFTPFLKSLGIHHRIICPHTHHQNGLVKRKHRHIVDIGLTLLSQASLPLKYWDHAFHTAVYLINRLPTSAPPHTIPYSTIFNKHYVYNFLKTFGCACYPHTRPYHTHKLQFRSTPCIFLGSHLLTRAINVLMFMANYLFQRMFSLMKIPFLFFLNQPPLHVSPFTRAPFHLAYFLMLVPHFPFSMLLWNPLMSVLSHPYLLLLLTLLGHLLYLHPLFPSQLPLILCKLGPNQELLNSNNIPPCFSLLLNQLLSSMPCLLLFGDQLCKRNIMH